MEYFSVISQNNGFPDIINLLKLIHTLTKEKSSFVLNETHLITKIEYTSEISAEAINCCINEYSQENICLKKYHYYLMLVKQLLHDIVKSIPVNLSLNL